MAPTVVSGIGPRDRVLVFQADQVAAVKSVLWTDRLQNPPLGGTLQDLGLFFGTQTRILDRLR